MSGESLGVNLKVIGVVRNDYQRRPEVGWRSTVSEIIVDPTLTDALDGLEEFSHIVVIFWMHQLPATDQVSTKVHPGRRKEIPEKGIFATRTPYRVNPIGSTTVRLLERRGNILKVEMLDAIDGTPVIDIKPYIPRHDLEADAKVPEWLNRLKAKDY